MFKYYPVPKMPDNYPKFGNAFTRGLGKFVLWIFGWKIEGKYPENPKLVVAAAPHTSNWDFVIGLASQFSMSFKAHWLGKHTLFFWPVKGLLIKLGGIPVVRHAAANMVEQVAERYQENDKLIIAIAPEGTRKQVEKLKTGFVRIAIEAKVPIWCIAFDYPSKTLVLGDVYQPTGDVDKDELYIRDYFRRFKGQNPDQYCK